MDRIRKTFFGKCDVPGSVIITPIAKVYNSIALDGEGAYKGWWDSKEGTINGKRYLVSKIPQRGAIDAVLSLKDSNILLIGYCGSMGKVPVGEIVCSSACLKIDETEFPTLDWTPFRPVATCHSDAFLLESEGFLKNVRSKGAEAIDMETFDMYKYCRLSGNRGMSVLIVTDIPGKLPFYDVREEHKRAIESGIMKVSKMLGELP
jgi:purine-nucleoside phosphorylase